MSTSFVVNAADLAKILDQIKIAERNAAGENLVDIIGQDAHLLPLGLRTVDGSFNHLLPGQEQAGAADELFPRLLTPNYRFDNDGDTMPFGPPGGPVVTNTNYDPTIPGGVDPFGVNLHSVADADPRIISNLIVDQTLSNRSALVAALLVVNGLFNGDNAGPASTMADEILAARAAAEAAGPAAAATAAAYAAAQPFAGTASTELASALASLTALRGDAADDGDAQNGVATAAAALSAANNALTAVTSMRNALIAQGAVDPVDIANANLQVTNVQGLVTAVTAVQDSLAGGLTVPEFNAIVNAEASAQGLSAAALATAASLANSAANSPATVFAALIVASGLEISSDGSILIEHRSADIGLSPGNSGWMTFFGQFFDHGLDLVTKGGNGTIYIPLQADDPLIAGHDHILGTADDLPPEFRFMTLSRVTPFIDPVTGLPTEAQNTTTPFVDQNQTYTSIASHQVFLREYAFSQDTDLVLGNDSFALNTGRLLDGAHGGIATWGEVKAQAAEKLGLLMNDIDVFNVPKLVVDAYGKFTPGANGFAQVYVKIQVVNDVGGTVAGTLPAEFIMEGTQGGLDLHALPVPSGLPGLPPGQHYVVSTVGTGHAFLNDIAHNAVPVIIGGVLQQDANDFVDAPGTVLPNDGQGHNLVYDNELLDSHFATGDGRGNENIGLTTVHTIFHSEHNRLVEVNKDTLVATGDVAVVNQWLAAGVGGVRNAITQAQLDDINALAEPAKAAAIDALNWDGERLFQAARFVTEMQYQHLVFEEFARRIQPNVDPFVFTNSADLNPAIIAEFAHTVYRFGHSMLTDTVDRLDNDLALVSSNFAGQEDAAQVSLIEAFLNPQEFTASAGIGNLNALSDETAAGAIIRGMTRQVGNEIDEFVVEALRNNLLGLPLDLPVLNLARGRETGIPSLNDSRAQIYAMTGAADLKPYTSWTDFTQHIKHPLSVINFIAAYGTHPLIEAETTLAGKRAAAMAIVLGVSQEVPANASMDPPVVVHTIAVPDDRLDFLNATGAYAPDGAGANDDSLGGLNYIDLWVGGLAEEINQFGGQLGSTFNFVFEYQLEQLQNGDRFYYLSRTQGMNLLNLLEPNTFTDLIMRNTDLGDLHATHLSAEIMEVPDMILELDTLVAQEDYNGAAAGFDVAWDDAFQQAIDPKVVHQLGTIRVDINGDPVLDAGGDVIRDGGVLKFSGGEHVVLGGTEGNDRLIGDLGIDSLWGDGGNDYLNAGMESDQVFGGEGDDIIEDPFGDDFLRGEAGDDVIVADLGIDLLFGGEGQDFIMGVTDIKEVFAGPGNDFVLGGTAPDNLMGNEGDDWIEGGEGFDGLSGENSELFFNSTIIGHDILDGQGNDTDYDGENGDDIMVQGPGIQRSNGMDGFDWAIHKGDSNGADSDLGIRPFDTRQALILRDRFDSVEGLSGWNHDDILTGASKLILGENFNSDLTQAGVDRIHGLRHLLGDVANTGNPNDVVLANTPFAGNEIILGGDGSDQIRGNLGDDIIDGDAWLNVRIAVHETKDLTGPVMFSVDGLTSIISASNFISSAAVVDDWIGKSLAELMRTGKVNPGHLEAVREILYDNATDGTNPVDTNVDVAIFSNALLNYTIETDGLGNFGDFNGDGFVSVTDNTAVGGGGGGVNDGTDRLRNIEVLHFADGSNVFLDSTITNSAATGALAVSITQGAGGTAALDLGDTLTAGIGTVVDADGVPLFANFDIIWQMEQTPGAGDWVDVTDPAGNLVFGPVFTPVAGFGVEGLRLRVVGTFTDGHGLPETVFSDPTDPVGAGPGGGTTLPPVVGSPFLPAVDEDSGPVLITTADLLLGTFDPDTPNTGLSVLNLVVAAGSGGTVIDNTDGTWTFTPVADQNGPVTFQFDVTDGVNIVPDIATLEIVAVNDTPTAVQLNGSVVTENVAGAVIGAVSTIDVDFGDTFTYTVSDNRFEVVNDQLKLVAGTSLDFEVTPFVDLSVTSTDAGGLSVATPFHITVQDVVDPPPPGVIFTGTNAADSFVGTAGNDTFNTLRGNDIMTGAGGNDILNGDRGVDTAVFAGSLTRYGFSLSGANLVVTDSLGADGSDTLNGIELLRFGGIGGQTFTLGQGTNGVNTLRATNADNLLLGFNGADTMNGRAGNDALFGGDGNDRLDGGRGVDILKGDGGNDTFVFRNTAEANGDTILDYQAGDVIDLTGIDANTGLGGNNAFTTILNGGAFTGAAQLMLTHAADADGLYTVLHGNVDANAADDFQIILRGQHFTEADLNIIK